MKDAENKNYSRDLVLRVSPSRNAFVVEEHKPGGTKVCCSVSWTDWMTSSPC